MWNIIQAVFIVSHLTVMTTNAAHQPQPVADQQQLTADQAQQLGTMAGTFDPADPYNPAALMRK